MPCMNAKGYCRNCKKDTSHRHSLKIICRNCGLVSTQKEYRKGEEEKKKLSKNKQG